MNRLRCPGCGAVAVTGPTYPPRCGCGREWGVAEDVPPSVFAREPRPLWPDPRDPELLWMREDLNPTGSFKDRGAEVLIGVALAAGARRLVLDSSGSAALAAARVATVAGLPLDLHAPAGLAAAKRSAIHAWGATLQATGTRTDAAIRAEAAAGDAFWFSHVHHPAFLEGTAGSGHEALAALGHDHPMDWILPVGNGSLLLGLHRAVTAARAPVRLVAVQSAACAGLRDAAPEAGSLAAGIAIPAPPRREQILAAMRDTDGELVLVEETAIRAGWQALAAKGIAADPAAGAVQAAWESLRSRAGGRLTVAWLTGAGNRG